MGTLPTWRNATLLAYAFTIIVIGVVAYVILRFAVPDTVAAVLSAGMTIALSNLFQRQREIEAAQRTQKIAAYNNFADAIFDEVLIPVQQSITRGEQYQPDAESVTKSFMEVGKGLSMWGSDEVIAYYAGFFARITASGNGESTYNLFDECATLIMKLRADLGYQNVGIQKNDFKCLFGLKSCQHRLP